MGDAATDYVRQASNLTVYSWTARAGPHRGNPLTFLEFIDALHRDLTTPPDNYLTTRGE